MAQSSEQPDADRNLLFGILALQVNFISPDALVAAMHAWVVTKKKPLGQLLLEEGILTADQVLALEALVVQHLQLHGDDSKLSLQALDTASATRSALASIRDFDVQSTLAKLGSESTVEETHSSRPLPNPGARYRRLRHHADGGLGKIYLAEDTELHREVALKEIKQEHADNLDSRGRFVLEAEITGGLEHPGIVPVYGLGVYPNGRPYYAMRFIRGDSLKEAIDDFHAADKPGRDFGERSLAFRQMLRRFVDVCNAVAYAHSRGVLHRDLKPANVMLGKFGETLVVDWGLAKAGIRRQGTGEVTGSPEEERTMRPASGSTVDPTQAGVTLGTPPFMSPELAAGRHLELGPASDIYSLGSTLYVLLTGKRAYPATTREEVLAQVRSGQFPPPTQVKPETPPALDAICRKAMSFAPKDRYATALAFAADVEHWLADEPVAAYPEPWTATAGRWARRHRAAVAGAGVFLVSAVFALAISTALISAEQRKTAEQKRVAVENYALSRRQTFDLIKLIEATEPELAAVPALHEKRRDLLTAASGACGHYLGIEPNDVELQKQTALIYRFTANFHRLMNETQAAEPLYKESIRLQEGLIQASPEDAICQLNLSSTLRDYANLEVKLGRLREAKEKVTQALDIADKQVAKDPTRASYRRSVGTALLNLASNEYLQGQHEKAKKTAETVTRAVEIYRGLLDAPLEERHPYEPLLLAAALNLQAMIERDGGRADAAESVHVEALKQLKGMVDKKSRLVNNADVLHFMALCRLEQAKTWAKMPKTPNTPKYLASAEKQAGLVAVQMEGLAQEHKKMPTYRETLASAYQFRGQLRTRDKRYKEADDDFKKANGLLQELVAKHPELPELRGELGKSLAGLSLTGRELGSKDSAKFLEDAKAELQRAVAEFADHVQLKRSLDALPDLAP